MTCFENLLGRSAGRERESRADLLGRGSRAGRVLLWAALASGLAMTGGEAQTIYTGPGPALPTNHSPTAADIDGITDGGIVQGIPSDFVMLLGQQKGVAPLFYPSYASSPVLSSTVSFVDDVASELSSADQASLNSLAVTLAAGAVSTSTQFGFDQTVDTSAVSASLGKLATQAFVDRVATAIYAVRFRQNATGPDNTRFSSLIGNAAAAAAYQAYVTKPPYMNQLRAEIETNAPQARHRATLVTYKLSRMQDSAYQAVSATFKKNGLPVYVAPWTDLFSASNLNVDFLQEQTSHWISFKRTEITGSQSTGFGTFTNTYTTTYGPSVEDFLNGPAKQAGLTSGKSPKNTSQCQGEAGTSNNCGN